MTPQHVISQLLESDTKYPTNLDLLKKIIYIAYLGRLRINGFAPDNKVSLGNYLFDDERIMFDFTRLSDESRELFKQWLLEEHQNEKESYGLSDVAINEYRGFTAEVSLSWWGTIKQWFMGSYSENWKINDLDLSFNYQLTGIQMLHGKHGILIGFSQYLVPPTGSKYRNPEDTQEEPLGNTKRVFITDRLVEQLLQVNLKNIKFETVCKQSHPQAIDVTNEKNRFDEMYAYRKMQRFVAIKYWYVRLWNWISSFFYPEEKSKREVESNPLESIYQSDRVTIYQRTKTKELVVTEKKPDIDNIVFCGGGAKIFAHVGVWKAINEANIQPKKFAGSSAGAVMALMCYLGYSYNEISDFFNKLKQEHLINYDFALSGLSDSSSLKTAMDYIIAKKVDQIASQYKLPFPSGKITFATLDALRRQCPNCGIGTELVVTATNKRLGETRYFSLARSPDMEVSDAVRASASFPVLFRPSLIDGEEHNDGGILNNFPTEAFSDDHSTFLESEYGNNLKVLAVQFDNGTERNTLDKVRDRVYRENPIANAIYSFITGVSDPASGWEQDRMKLRKYLAQSLIVDVGNVSSSSFSIGDEERLKMIVSGYKSAKEFFDVRYSTCNGSFESQELMYSTFSSLGDLLAYCCYRGDKAWFETVNNLIQHSPSPDRRALGALSLKLTSLYFGGDYNSNSEPPPEKENPLTFFNNPSPQLKIRYREFLVLYPIFLKLNSQFFRNKKDAAAFENARHQSTSEDPFKCMAFFNQIKDETHVLFPVLINIMKQLKNNPSAKAFANINQVLALVYSDKDLFKDEFYGRWNISLPQSLRILKLLNTNNLDSAAKLLIQLRGKVESMQSVQNGNFIDEISDESLDIYKTFMSRTTY